MYTVISVARCDTALVNHKHKFYHFFKNTKCQQLIRNDASNWPIQWIEDLKLLKKKRMAFTFYAPILSSVTQLKMPLKMVILKVFLKSLNENVVLCSTGLRCGLDALVEMLPFYTLFGAMKINIFYKNKIKKIMHLYLF